MGCDLSVSQLFFVQPLALGLHLRIEENINDDPGVWAKFLVLGRTGLEVDVEESSSNIAVNNRDNDATYNSV